jgi:hypothetical protein
MQKTLSTLTIILVFTLLAAGCGGKGTQTPPPPAIAQASGLWHATFSPAIGTPVAVTLNMSQGPQSGLSADGFPLAPLNVAAVFTTPACPGLQGTSASGSVNGHAIFATLNLTDGETVTIQAGVNNDAPAAILFNGKYSVTAGPASCFGSSGTISGHQ